MASRDTTLPQLGFGLGLRPTHYDHIFNTHPAVDWFEVISENFMDTDGRPRRNLERIRADYPVVLHGVALSIGTVDPLHSAYLEKLKALIDWVQPAWVSDHLCWTGVAHRNTHDLLPVPYTEAALNHIVERIQRVQDILGRPIALENPSTYLEFTSSTMPEAEFIARMVARSGCLLLLDVNNIYVTCFNHRLDPQAYIDAMPLDHVIQIHLAGHDHQGTHIVDTHDDHVAAGVWALYQYTLRKAGRVPNTMIEWDDHIPPFTELYAELQKARAVAATSDDLALPDFSAPRSEHTVEAPITLDMEQRRMQAAIISGSDAAPHCWIRDKAGFPPHAQLGVYVHAYRARLRAVVTEDFPVLAHYVGAERFRQLIAAYIATILSNHYNIGRYAMHLPAFVATHFPQDGAAHDIAMLELALTQVADAAETPALDAEALVGLTPEALLQSVLQPRAALQLMRFTYPINRYFRAVMEDEAPPPLVPETSYLAVFRHEGTLWRADMAPDEYRLLAALMQGQRLGAALADQDIAAETLSAWFARWMQGHLLSQIITH